ncbi:MAG: hypothetical protein LUH53_04360 [Lachnospiraceae bacterium]|nr:hypothetical protein [Lachnospiraceae bacterium]
MNRTEREMKSDWEDSWERSDKNRGNGLTSAQIFLIILAVLLAAALIGILVLYFFL